MTSTRAKVLPLVFSTPATLSERAELAARRRFRFVRMARFSSMLEAAVFLQVAPRTVERWEAGAVRIPAWALVALEDAFPAVRTPPAETQHDTAVPGSRPGPGSRRAA